MGAEPRRPSQPHVTATSLEEKPLADETGRAPSQRGRAGVRGPEGWRGSFCAGASSGEWRFAVRRAARAEGRPGLVDGKGTGCPGRRLPRWPGLPFPLLSKTWGCLQLGLRSPGCSSGVPSKGKESFPSGRLCQASHWRRESALLSQWGLSTILPTLAFISSRWRNTGSLEGLREVTWPHGAHAGGAQGLTCA